MSTCWKLLDNAAWQLLPADGDTTFRPDPGEHKLKKALRAVKDHRNNDFGHAVGMSMDEPTFTAVRAAVGALLTTVESRLAGKIPADAVARWRREVHRRPTVTVSKR